MANCPPVSYTFQVHEVGVAWESASMKREWQERSMHAGSSVCRGGNGSAEGEMCTPVPRILRDLCGPKQHCTLEQGFWQSSSESSRWSEDRSHHRKRIEGRLGMRLAFFHGVSGRPSSSSFTGLTRRIHGVFRRKDRFKATTYTQVW